jgi:Domain of unknown function (DUF397)
MATTGHDLARAAWRKSTRSGSGNCIETAPVHGGIAVRDSASPAGAILAFTPGAWTAFLTALKTDSPS